MEIERYKKLAIPKIQSGMITEKVRNIIKEEKYGKQDVKEDRRELFEPITDVQTSLFKLGQKKEERKKKEKEKKERKKEKEKGR